MYGAVCTKDRLAAAMHVHGRNLTGYHSYMNLVWFEDSCKTKSNLFQRPAGCTGGRDRAPRAAAARERPAHPRLRPPAGHARGPAGRCGCTERWPRGRRARAARRGRAPAGRRPAGAHRYARAHLHGGPRRPAAQRRADDAQGRAQRHRAAAPGTPVPGTACRGPALSARAGGRAGRRAAPS